MLKLDAHASGRHFLHIPGPSPVPSRVLRAISYQTIDHRGPEFGQLGLKLLEDIKRIFQTTTSLGLLSNMGMASGILRHAFAFFTLKHFFFCRNFFAALFA